MKLESVLNNTGAVILHGTPDTEISAITSDSRKAGSGSLFLAGEALVALGAYPWAVKEPDANEIMAH